MSWPITGLQTGENVPETTARTDPAATDRAPRKASRDARRRQLIEATIAVMAVRGYARMTLTEVARQAGLSHGLVNFHFASKENLLGETLVYLADEYRLNWTASLSKAAPDPASQLDALLRADFNPSICTPDRQAAWCSFWGEAQSRPLYQKKCGANDDAYNARMEAICADLIRDGGYDCSPVLAARALRVTVEGVWLDMMTMTTPYAVADGLATALASAAAFFPKHFDANGCRRD
jgi:TetR/AcrR family transcriptional repressor of bet genes